MSFTFYGFCRINNRIELKWKDTSRAITRESVFEIGTLSDLSRRVADDLNYISVIWRLNVAVLFILCPISLTCSLLSILVSICHIICRLLQFLFRVFSITQKFARVGIVIRLWSTGDWPNSCTWRNSWPYDDWCSTPSTGGSSLLIAIWWHRLFLTIVLAGGCFWNTKLIGLQSVLQ